jgi:O-6-methylguanine DNA methyltransferase
MLARHADASWDTRAGGVEAIDRFRYRVDGWGSGELHVRGDLVLAHDLVPSSSADRAALTPGSSEPALCTRASGHLGAPGPAPAASPGPAPLQGGARPPAFTLAREATHVSTEFVSNLLARIDRQLAGEETRYDDVPIDLSWCTPFQASLAAALRAVPWGEVVTYGELAALAGRPGAARAAGSFCAQNRFWLLVPCHRVVAADGIGGYGEAGVPLKRRLLALEGVEL